MSNLRDLRKKLRERLRQRPETGGSFLPPAGGQGPASETNFPVPDGGDSFLPPVTRAASAGDSLWRQPPAGDPEPAAPSPGPAPREQPAASPGTPASGWRYGGLDDSPGTPASGWRYGGLDDSPVAMDEALPGQVLQNSWGECWVYRPGVDPLRLAVPATARGKLGELRQVAPERVLVLDLETCGLQNVPLFLVGLASGVGEVEILLARQLAEEPAVVQAAAARLAAAEAVVTFNGITFDVPFLSARARYFGIELPWPALHIDLLPIARRRYGKRHGNCKLVTLESAVLGRRRTGKDIPGAEIPGVYQRFTETGDGRLLQPIAYHNAQDLLACLGLASVA